MMNNFQVEIIRQFEIQKGSLSHLVEDYLLDHTDSATEEFDKQDLADGDSEVFLDKYGAA